MNVGELQSFLRHLGTLLEANKGAKLGADFQALCEGLEPFKDRPVADFAHFLRVAEELHRTGKLPESAVKKPAARKSAPPKPPKPPKPVLKKKGDTEAVETAAAVLQRLYDRATDPALTHEEIERELDRIEAEFDPNGLKEVAKKFGIKSGMRGKADAKKQIHDRIASRKGQAERGQVIARQAEHPPHAPTPTPPPPAQEPDVVLFDEPSPAGPG